MIMEIQIYFNSLVLCLLFLSFGLSILLLLSHFLFTFGSYTLFTLLEVIQDILLYIFIKKFNVIDKVFTWFQYQIVEKIYCEESPFCPLPPSVQFQSPNTSMSINSNIDYKYRCKYIKSLFISYKWQHKALYIQLFHLIVYLDTLSMLIHEDFHSPVLFFFNSDIWYSIK